MSLIKQTFLFILINFLVGTLLIMANSSTSSTINNDFSLDDNTTSIDAGGVNDINDYAVTGSQFNNNSIPLWLSGTWILFNSIWGAFIVIGWIRGVK